MKISFRKHCPLLIGWTVLSGVACSSSRSDEPPVTTNQSAATSSAPSPSSSGMVDSPSSTTTQDTSRDPSATDPNVNTESSTSTASPITSGSSESDALSEMPSQENMTQSDDSAVSSAPTDPPVGNCNPSTATGTRAEGTGPHEVVVETNSDSGINEGTIFRPADLGGTQKYPIFVWGQGGCSRNGLSNATAMAEIASHGYFVVADGTPNGSGNRTMDRADLAGMGAPLIAYVDWAIAENEKPCSAYYQSLDVTKIASNGFSCGGLMAQGTVLDPRIVTWGVTSSGMAGATDDFYAAIGTPVLFVEGGPDDVAYEGALQGYTRVSELDVPVMWFDKALGHGGDLFQPDGGDFTKINLAWLNWWLKGDEGVTGKGLLVGSNCPYCSDSSWDVAAANLP